MNPTEPGSKATTSTTSATVDAAGKKADATMSKQAPTSAQQCVASNPCSGTGLASDANVKEFTEGFKQLQKDWPKLSADERQKRLEELSNKQLAKSGVPPVKVVKNALPKGNGGNLDFPNWQIAVNADMMDSPTLSDADAKKFADNLYHESRHAEQWYLMAQKSAADGKTAAQIRDEMGIPGSVAAAAEKAPLKAGSSKTKCADKMYDSVYGKNADERGKTLTAVMAKLDDLNKAKANNAKVQGDPKSTDKDKKAAEQKLKDSRAAFQEAHKKYKALPEETDAFESGGKVQAAW